MFFALHIGYIMLGIVFLTLLAGSSAELGYQYQQNSYGGPVNSCGNEAVLGDERYHSQPGNHYQENADFHKHFYALEAPYDSVEEVDLAETKLSSLAQKNLQVVFIKAPENKAVVGALNALVKQTSEDKTAIYVLNKQADVNELASQLSALKAHHKHKPQVHFVKYKTEEEAAQAQQYIQAQYGGGSSIPQPGKASSLGYYPEQQPQYEQDAPSEEYPAGQVGYLPSPQQSAYQPQSGYLPPLPSYSSISQGYNAAGSSAGVSTIGQIDLPPVPEAQQDLTGNYNNAGVDYRSERSRRVDFRANERHRRGSRMVFPSANPGKRLRL
uniref:RT06853p n=1 Tax=Drosophila melanogaster TaxID=7227 RepID=D4G7C8_DROME|nr:RT06853p [Drosophila melanogaster]